MHIRLFSILLFLSILSSCTTTRTISSEKFGHLSDGREVKLYHLQNSSGASIDLCDFGARILRINVPDRDNNLGDVVFGYGTLDSLEFGKERFMGCVIGRYANRINHASFTLDGTSYQLSANENRAGVPVLCHGGKEGFDRKIWKAKPLHEKNRVGIQFHYLSPDGEQGFPGNCDCYVTYWWNEDNVLRIEYDATTDKPTVVCLSNHTYFNLCGQERGNILDHQLWVDCDTCVIMNAQDCPSKHQYVEGTVHDYRTLRSIRDNNNPAGASSCWLIKNWNGECKKIADLYDPKYGRGVQTWSTEPCLLTWSGKGQKGWRWGKYAPMYSYFAMLLETIHVPDSPNQSKYPSTTLRPGEKYHTYTEYRFYSK